MKVRQFYYFIFVTILMIAYFFLSFWISNISTLQAISLLFITLAYAMLYFLPVLLPKKEQGYQWMRVKCYVVCILYAFLVTLASYFFSFEFTMNSSFYFLLHTIGFTVIHFILLVCTFSPKPSIEEQENEQ